MPRKIGFGMIIGLLVGISATGCVGIEAASLRWRPVATTVPATPRDDTEPQSSDPTSRQVATTVPATPAPTPTANPAAPATPAG